MTNTTSNITSHYAVQLNHTMFEPELEKVQTCLRQKVRMTDAYTIGTVAYGLLAFPLGLFFDKFGLRITRTFLM